MAFYQFTQEQIIPADLETVWKFVSSPANLEKITPPSMGFQVTSPDLPETMYPGMIISYKVSPIPGWKTTWVTEITQVNEGRFFIDEQRVGPYSLWHHQHHLEAIQDGVLMKDIVSYKPPFGVLGALANRMMIR